MRVEADVFADGHDHVAARLLFRFHEIPSWTACTHAAAGQRPLARRVSGRAVGEYLYTVAGWIDHFDTWRSDLEKRIAAGQDIRVDLLNGAQLVEQAAARAGRDDATALRRWAALLRETGDDPGCAGGRARSGTGRDDGQLSRSGAGDTLRARAARHRGSREGALLGLVRDVSALDRDGAGAAWHVSGLRGAARLRRRDWDSTCSICRPSIRSGRAFAKGRTIPTTAEPAMPGSPWAIGAKEGGHTAIHPQLGTLEDFRALVERRGGQRNRARARHRLPVFARSSLGAASIRSGLRSAPTERFSTRRIRPRNTRTSIRWISRAATGRRLWDALRDVFCFWIEQGVRIFRVDNPHTKAFSFWEWLIAEIKRDYPDVLFLAEAFTRPRVMQRLAKLGFSQSYTYFTWRNTKQELTDYFTELTQTQVREYLRPNLWPNTPDILHETLQIGGRPAFLAAWCWPRRWDRITASTGLLLSWARTSRCGPAAKSI